MEASMCQVVGGATDVAAAGMIQYLDSFRARMNDDLRLCSQELRDARWSPATFGPPGPVHYLMGQVQGLWERLGMRQN